MGPPPLPDRTWETVGCALLSRLALLGLVSISVFLVNPLPYDSSTTLVFRGSSAPSASNTSAIDINEAWKPSIFGQVLTRLTNWDALYFATIAKQGYLWEHYHAFFPGFPFLMHGLQLGMSPFASDCAT